MLKGILTIFFNVIDGTMKRIEANNQEEHPLEGLKEEVVDGSRQWNVYKKFKLLMYGTYENKYIFI